MASSNSFNYMNNTAPFWDFLASLEQQGNSHPFFDQDGNSETERGENHVGQQPSPFDPWGWGHQFFGGGHGMPHRGHPPPPGPRGPPPPGHHGPSPPGPHGPPPGPHDPPPHHHEQTPHYEHDSDKSGEKSDNDNGEGSSSSGSDGEGRHSHGNGRHGRCGSRRGRHGHGGRGGFGHHGPTHDGPGHRGPRSWHHGHYGHYGPRGHHGPPHSSGPGPQGRWGSIPFMRPYRGFEGFGAGFNPSAVAAQLFEAMNAQHPSYRSGNDDTRADGKDKEDFTPEADIFDTASSYIVHVSLPGAKKEDVGVNWDAEKSELSVAGVIYRPGDEELLKTLAMEGRKVGPFERKIRLGTRANPARVDANGITAKLEDGILRVEVRKEDEGFVEIKKVDIE